MAAKSSDEGLVTWIGFKISEHVEQTSNHGLHEIVFVSKNFLSIRHPGLVAIPKPA